MDSPSSTRAKKVWSYLGLEALHKRAETGLIEFWAIKSKSKLQDRGNPEIAKCFPVKTKGKKNPKTGVDGKFVKQ